MTSLGNGERRPFVSWPKDDEKVFVEGVLAEIWTGNHGLVARLDVHAASENAVGVLGSGELQERIAMTAGTKANIGLDLAQLKQIEEVQVGHVLHVAFNGWAQTKDGKPLRDFDVFAFSDVADF